jgi:hypothetical protein
MSVAIKIKKASDGGFVDRTDQVADYSVVLGTTKEASTGTLVVEQYGAKYLPDGEDLVQFFVGSTKVFAGVIVRLTQQLMQGPSTLYDCDLKDLSYFLDSKLVNVAYTAMTAHDIILDIVANFAGDFPFTTANVEDDGSAIVDSIVFDNVPVSDAIQQIADLFGKDWYVDVEGDIHFFSKFLEVAPFNITDTNGLVDWESIKIVRDYTQIRNSILIEAGNELSTAPLYDNFVGDGEQNNFPLTRQYNDIAITLNGTPLIVGIANIDSFTDHDVLYDFNLRSIYFNPAGPPDDGDTIVAGGNYYFPINVRVRAGSSISAYGEKQFLIQDSSIKSRADAISRAKAEISAYARSVNEGGFDTYEPGLMAGQKITIDSPARGMNEDFIIQRITGKKFTPAAMAWTAEIVSVKTYELIDLLADILRGRKTPSTQDAVIGVAESITRGILVDRSHLSYLNDPPIWVAGPWIPVSLSDRRRVAFADTGCLAV